MRISVITNNGRRLKLAPAAAHKVLWPGYGVIPPEDAEGAKLYLAHLESLGLDPQKRKHPTDYLPSGYSVTERAGYFFVVHGDETVGRPCPTMAHAIALAHRDAGPVVAIEEATEPESDGLPDGYEIQYNRGWYTVVDPKGYQVGKATRSQEDAIVIAEQDAQGEQ